MKRKVLALLGCSLAIPAPAYASWELSSGDGYCAITGEYEDDGNSKVSMARDVDDRYLLFISNENWSVVEGRQYELIVAFDDDMFSGKADGYDMDGEKGFMIKGGAALVNAFVAARRLVIMKTDNTIVLMAGLAGTTAGMQNVAGCVAAKKRERDRLLAEQNALEEKRKIIPADPFFDASDVVPRGNVARWATNDDYPAAAMREEREGVAGYRLTVDAAGRIANCEIISSTGHADLDAETCKVVQRRGRFNAAPAGSPSRFYENHIRWSIPR
jgi:protein TonB